MQVLAFIPTLVIFLVIIVVAIKITSNERNANKKHRGRYNYVQGQFSEQMEIDMRLPYKRFKELYPENKWTYEEYKAAQKRTAFRRSHSSQNNKRMVR